MKLTHVEGAVLAGGASSRMGRDKARIEWDGATMAERVAGALAECVERVRVVIRPGDAPPVAVPVIEDAHPARAPMVGVCAALRACEASAVLVAACDLPEVDVRCLLALLALVPARGGPDVVAPLGPKGPEPLLAVYRPELLAEIERRIAADQLSLQALIRDADTLLVPEDVLRGFDPELRTLRNVNTPEDL